MKVSHKIVLILMGGLFLVQLAIGMKNLAEGQHNMSLLNRNLRIAEGIK